MPNLKDLVKVDDQRVVLVDGMNLFHRVFYTNYDFTSESGHPTGVVFGFVNIMYYIREQFNANKFIIFWEGRNNWRKDEYNEYKAQEKTEDKWTEEQRERYNISMLDIVSFFNKAGILQFRKDGSEADDVIYLIANMLGEHVYILSNDKDYFQLVDDERDIKVIKPENGGRYSLCDEKFVIEKFGVPPKKFATYLGLVGDKSDNVKGVHKVGPVKALKLINEGKMTKNNIQSALTNDEIKQFIESYSVVNMKNILKKNIVINIGDVIYPDTEFDYDEIHKLFIDYDFKKFRALDVRSFTCKEFNKKIINMLTNKE